MHAQVRDGAATAAPRPEPLVLVLGPVAIAGAGGTTASLRGQQGQVLGLLAAAHPHPVPADALIDELWPDQPPRTARTGLRVVVARLRDHFGAAAGGSGPGAGPGGAVVHEGVSYRLAVGGERVDHVRFTAAVGHARDHLHHWPHQVAADLVDALGWWRGWAYQTFGSSPRLALHAAHLDELRREAEELLLDALLRSGQPDSAATWATTFVESEPYRERRWELLMLALYRTGRQAEALRAAQRVGALLRDDLGLEPSSRLRRLETDILAQAAHLDAPTAPAPTGSSRIGSGQDRAERGEPPSGGPSSGETEPGQTTPGETMPGETMPGETMPGETVTVEQFLSVLRNQAGAIPIPTNSFIGRSGDEAELAALVERSRLVTILGPPGVGKSRLAAHHVGGTADARVVWVDLVPLSLDTMVVGLASQVGVRLAGRPVGPALADALGRRRVTLVFDNCEHLAGVVAELAEALLAACPRLTVVATSRVPLSSPSERRLDLGPLSEADSVRLLIDRAGSSTLGGQDRRDLAALVHQLDGLPLAIELVAPALGTTPARDLAGQLGTTLEAATGPARPDPRHHSLQNALDWSLDLLDAQDRDLFDILGSLTGTFTAQDVAGLTGAAIEPARAALSRLAASRLVESAPVEGNRPGWRQLTSLRAHARARLARAGRLAPLEQAQAHRHVELVRHLAPDLAGPQEEGAVARLRRSTDQLRATHEWLVHTGALEASAAFSLAMWEYTFFRQDFGHFGWLDDTLALDGAAQLPDAHELLAQASLAAWARDRFEASVVLAQRAEGVALAAGRPVPLAALKARFNVAVHEGRVQDAAVFLSRLSSESVTQASPRHHADNLVVTALALAQFGLATEAAQVGAKGLDLAMGTGNPTSISWARVGVGSAQLVSDPVEAARSFSAAGRLARTVHNQWVYGMAMAGLVTAFRRQGRLEPARRLLVDLVEVWGRAHAVSQLGRAGQEAILLLAGQGQRQVAARLLVHLDLADHVHPLLPDDQEHLSVLSDELRRFDGAAGDADGPAGLAPAIAAALAGGGGSGPSS